MEIATELNPMRRLGRGLSLRRGFTLIELMVVILIIAILAALIVPRIVNRAGDAKKVKAQADISTLSNALNQFRIDCDRYPTTEDGLNALRVAPNDVQNWKGPYTEKSIPLDPWGSEYHYEAPGPNGLDYWIVSYGADQQPGGDGDNADIDNQ